MLIERLSDRAKFVRLETVRLTRIAGAGHYTATFSAAELFAALYYASFAPARTSPTGPTATASSSARAMPRSASIRFLRTSGSSIARCSTTTRGCSSSFGDHPDMRKIAGHRLQLGIARPRPIGRRRDGARRPDPRPLLPRLLHDGRRRARRRADLGSGDGREPVPARLARRDRRPKPPLDRRQHREHHGRRAARGAIQELRLEVQRIDGHDLDAILDAFDASRDRAVGRRSWSSPTPSRAAASVGWRATSSGTSATSSARTTTT